MNRPSTPPSASWGMLGVGLEGLEHLLRRRGLGDACPPDRRHVLDHLGLVVGMVDARGIGDGIAQATQQHPAMRELTVGPAVQAMLLKDLGCINQARSRVPRCCQHHPTDRLMAPRMAPAQLTAAALGRALETSSAEGITELYPLMAAPAAERMGLAPHWAHLARTRFPVNGRDHSDEEPEEQIGHSTRGCKREHRPDVPQVLWELIGVPQAGLPRLLKPAQRHQP